MCVDTFATLNILHTTKLASSINPVTVTVDDSLARKSDILQLNTAQVPIVQSCKCQPLA